MKHEPAPLWIIALLTVALASPALAVDGVLEINQACAVNTGCFSGDAAGLPVTITAAGSYRLTGNLTVPDENTDGIVVNASDVGIDLNDFAIIGLVCVGVTTSACMPSSGSGSGINGIHQSGISVKNGSITGMGWYGVGLGPQAKITNLRVRWNRHRAIYARYGSIISGNVAFENGDNGIFAYPGCTVSGNTVYKNTLVGIYAGHGSTISGNTAYNNGHHGFSVNRGSTVSGNTARSNTGYGLQFLDTDSAYSENVISNNTAGTVIGTAVQLGQNACNGNTTCP
jgi:parallel beta-helix repeat protein